MVQSVIDPFRIPSINQSPAEIAEMEAAIEAGALPKDFLKRHIDAVDANVFGGGLGTSFFERFRRDVHSRHLPSMAREVYRRIACSTTDIDRGAHGQRGRALDQLPQG